VFITVLYFLLSFCSVLISCSQAEVITDGSMGAARNLSGPDYQIAAQLGQQHGVNLFHSFQQFNLATGEQVTFSGPDSVQRIFSRVTGGNASLIDGTIRNQISGADLYLLNPAGVMFGEQARLDTSGSFYVSTAEQLSFQDGSTFYSDLSQQSTFTAAAPSAFGFLSDSPAAISVTGSQLTVPTGKTLALIGGDLSVKGEFVLDEQGEVQTQATKKGQTTNLNVNNVESSLKIYTPVFTTALQANSGRLYLVSLNQAGEVVLTPTAATVTDDQGKTVVTAGGSIEVERALLNAKGDDGGTVFIHGGDVTLSDMQLWNQNINGAGGNTHIQANTLHILGGLFFTGIDTTSYTLGQSGSLLIRANDVLFEKGVVITTEGLDQSGHVLVEVTDNFYFIGQRVKGHYLVGMLSNSTNSMQPITEPEVNSGFTDIIVGGDLQILNGAEIGGISVGSANAPDLQFIIGGELFISGAMRLPELGERFVFNSAILSNSYAGSNIAKTLQYDSVPLAGKSGSLFIKAKTIKLDNEGLISVSTHQGKGGDMRLEAQQILLLNSSMIDSNTSGTGQAGNIEIYADQIFIEGTDGIQRRPSRVASDSSRDLINAGDAGYVKVVANEIMIEGNAEISAKTFNAAGGNLEIKVSDKLLLVNGGRLTTSVGGGDQNSGNIKVSSEQFVILNNGKIISQAIEGDGGNIIIEAAYYLPSTNSLISAASQLGIDGEVYIMSTKLDLEDHMLALSDNFLDVVTQFMPKCDLADIKGSKFTIDLQYSGRLRSPIDFFE